MASETGTGPAEQSGGYLSRLVDVLEVVSSGRALTLTEVASETGIPPSTAHRLLGLLLDRGYARRLEGTRGFVAGPSLQRIGLRALSQRQGRFDEVVREIAGRTGESVSLGMLQGREIVLVSRRESDHPLRYVISVGDPVAIDATAMGMVVVASSTEEQRGRLLRRLPDGGAAFLEERAGELREAARRGYAIWENSGEVVGLMCVAVPLLDADREVIGGISVAGPTVRFSRRAAQATVAHLQRAAAGLSDGFIGPW
ncbi:MAG TPA: IclR family transcriptional regulator [Candidatus Dormibacteraeota bacterium]|nr:IclR family transcriptional regulator [Candidatus Dormibacteraeota bacterium]